MGRTLAPAATDMCEVTQSSLDTALSRHGILGSRELWVMIRCGGGGEERGGAHDGSIEEWAREDAAELKATLYKTDFLTEALGRRRTCKEHMVTISGPDGETYANARERVMCGVHV